MRYLPLLLFTLLCTSVSAQKIEVAKGYSPDKWFNAKVRGSRNMNNHWAWYHVMEHQANHMGQIRLITGRM